MNLRTFDLNLLHVLVAVYNEKNVSRAAEAVGLSQPAASNALLRLRRTCNDPLFVRTTRGMEPTALAHSLIGPVREALELLHGSLGQPLTFEPKKAVRTFKLLMSDAGESSVLPPLMEVIEAEAPSVSIDALRIPHNQYVEVLESGGADLAIGNLPFLDAGFHQGDLFTDPYCCIARRGHIASRRRLTLAQFLAAKHVSIATGNADELVDAALRRTRSRRTIKLRVTHYHVAIDIVAKTDLLAVVPQNTVRDVDTVSRLALPFEVIPAKVRQFWHRTAHSDPGNRWLRSVLASLDLGPR